MLAIVLWIGLPIAQGFAPVINLTLGVKTQQVIPDDDAKIYFWTNYETEEELIAHEQELCRQIEAEGAALLINRDNTLPLSAGTKFSVFSSSSVNPIYGGTGSGQVKADDAVTFQDALNEAFGEGAVKKSREKQAVPEGAACKIFVEKGLVQWKNQPFGVIMNL